MRARTPGPWGWQKFGDEWMLVGQHGQRPVVLSIRRSGPVKERGFTSLVGGRLVPFDPSHPDARQLAAASALADALDSLVGSNVPKADDPCHAGITTMENCTHCRLILAGRAALRAAGRLP